MDMFTLPFLHPAEFFISLAIGGGFVYIFQKAAMSSEQRETAWVRRFVTGPNSKVLWGVAWLVWAVGFGLCSARSPTRPPNHPTVRSASSPSSRDSS